MSVWYELLCDSTNLGWIMSSGCEETYVDPFASHSSIRKLRKCAKNHGWVKIRHEGISKDVCPACAAERNKP